MARTYSAKTAGQAPLQLQLYLPNGASGYAFITSAWAEGETDVGSASIPVISLVTTTPGIGTPIKVTSLDPNSPPSGAGSDNRVYVLDTYTTPPAPIPAVNEGAFNLPIRWRWDAPSPKQGYILGPLGFPSCPFCPPQPANPPLLLYAKASGGHTWSGGFIWEDEF